MTTWNEDGTFASHGRYIQLPGQASTPHGSWTFWYQDGSKRSQGEYLLGSPDGCFSVWDAQGHRHSQHWSNEDRQFQDSDCKGPTRDEVADIEDQLSDSRTDTPELDFSVSTMFTNRGFGIENSVYADKRPTVHQNVELAIRRHLRLVALGALTSVRISEDGDTRGWVAAGTVSIPLPSPSPRIAFEATAALGYQQTQARLRLPDDPELEALVPPTFSTPYGALQLDAQIPLQQVIAIVIGIRGESGLPNERENTAQFNTPDGIIPYRHTWSVGRASLGLLIGLRATYF